MSIVSSVWIPCPRFARGSERPAAGIEARAERSAIDVPPAPMHHHPCPSRHLSRLRRRLGRAGRRIQCLANLLGSALGGSTGRGSGDGDVLGAFISGLCGRAIGGPGSAGGFYEVNEKRPELLNVAGKQRANPRLGPGEEHGSQMCISCGSLRVSLIAKRPSSSPAPHFDPAIGGACPPWCRETGA